MTDVNDNREELRSAAARADQGSVCLNLKKAARATSSVLDELLAPIGIRASQFSVLNQISLLGAPTMTELADASVSDRTTLTRNLGPLERDGYVEIVTGRDRRVRTVQLTDTGRDLLAKALPLREQAECLFVAGLGDGPWRELLSQLAKLTQIARTE